MVSDRWVLLDGRGEVAAVRETYGGACAAVPTLEAHWREAAACGHPTAPRHAAERLGRIEVHRIPLDDLDDEVGYLDREP